MADSVQSKYDQLDDIAGRFGRQAESSGELQRRVAQATQALEQGGWQGRGAAAFFGEMRGELQPATQRLIAALQAAQSVTLQIKTIMQQAEQEAANPFKSDGHSLGSVVEPGGKGGPGAGTAVGGAGGPGGTGTRTGVGSLPTSELKKRLHTAMDPFWSTDEAAITRTLNLASDAQKSELLADRALMERLRGELLDDVNEYRDVAKQFASVAHIRPGPLRDQVAELIMSTREVDNNTAQHLIKGTIRTYYIQDLQQPPNIRQWLEAEGYDPAKYTIYLTPPDNIQPMVVQKSEIGFAMPGSTNIYVSNTIPGNKIKETLVHETNHARNAPYAWNDMVGRYKSEFRGYWVEGGDADKIADPARRAAAIRKYVLETYSNIRKAYNSDPAVRRQIDAHTTPDGNLTNR